MHYFGDRYEERFVIGGRKCWKIPVMEGEYVGEERFGTKKGIAGGNFLVMGSDQRSALAGAEAAMEKITGTRGVVTSFAGGIVASGSKVGCRNYHFPMPASTSHRWCPTLKGRICDSLVPDGVASVYEIVVNGVDEVSVKAAMKAGILAATGPGLSRTSGHRISTGNSASTGSTSTRFSGNLFRAFFMTSIIPGIA